MLSIHTLEAGVIYRVTRPFTDYYQNDFTPGTRLTYAGRAYLPYHGGHTLFFREGNIYLQEDVDAALIDSFHEYLTVFDAAGRVAPPPPSAPAYRPMRWRVDVFVFVFFALAGIALCVLFLGPARPPWLALVPFSLGLLILIAGAIIERRNPS